MAKIIISILLLISFQSQSQIAMFHAHNQAPTVEYLLDDYPAALVAYSLRKLDSDYAGYAIRVRRASDDAEQDIGFVSNRDLDTAALKSFIGSSNAFVSIWYDQSGNGRNAVQTTNARQSRIALAGSVQRDLIKKDGELLSKMKELETSKAETKEARQQRNKWRLLFFILLGVFAGFLFRKPLKFLFNRVSPIKL